MPVFESLNNTTNKALEKGEDLLKQTEAYYKLKLFQSLTMSISLLVKFATIGAFALIAFIFIAVALSSAIGKMLDNETYGYFAVAGIFMMFAFITFLLRNKIENLIIKHLSHRYFLDNYNENI